MVILGDRMLKHKMSAKMNANFHTEAAETILFFNQTVMANIWIIEYLDNRIKTDTVRFYTRGRGERAGDPRWGTS